MKRRKTHLALMEKHSDMVSCKARRSANVKEYSKFKQHSPWKEHRRRLHGMYKTLGEKQVDVVAEPK